MKKTITALMLTAAVSASAITITVNQDTPAVLDFNIEWGSPVETGPYNGKVTGPGGSVVWWMGIYGRNQNSYWVEIKNAFESKINGFALTFWANPEYYGPVPSEYGSPNIRLGLTNYPLENNPYGARFVYPVLGGVTVPDSGSAWLLMAFGLAGIGLAGAKCLPPASRASWKASEKADSQ